MATKRLALELGLVQKRKLKGCSSSDVKAAQEFDYLVVLDFESTCWETGPRMGRQEIIEFPAVLLHLASGEILSEFQQYVMPIEQPVLSEFCKDLTGITQDQVEAGMPLGACLCLFSNWIRKLCDEHQMSFNTSIPGKHVTFATWSDWDLGVCLHYECSRKQLKKPEFFNQWIDVKVTYKNFYRRRPQGLAGALKDLGVAFEGREHSGICDTRNTAVLISRMAKDGCVLKVTKSLSTKPKGNTVKEAAQKLFKHVKNVVFGKRAPEETQDETNRKKLSISKPGSVQLSDRCEVERIQATEKSKSINLSKDNDNKFADKRCMPSTSKTVVVSKPSAPPLRCITNTVQSIITPVGNTNAPKLPEISKSDTFKTPVIPKSSVKLSLGLSKSSLRTPNSCQGNTSGVSDDSRNFHRFKKTPPICGCGRRARLLLTSKPGPNEGRYFFSCPNGGASIKKRCKFFKWEDEPYINAPILNLSSHPSAKSVPLQRTFKVHNPGSRVALSEPMHNKIRHLGLSKNGPSGRLSQQRTPLFMPCKPNSSATSPEPFEVTPFVVKQKSRLQN